MVIDNEIVKSYKSGMSLDEIAHKTGKSERWVRQKLIDAAIEMRPPVRKKVTHDIIQWTTKDDRDTLIVKMYKEGNGAYTISKKLNIGKRTVFRVLSSKGIQTDKNRKSSKLSEEQIKQAEKLYVSGSSSVAVAQYFGVTDGAIQHHLKKKKLARTAADTMSIIPVDLQDEIVRLYTEDNLSTYKIAAKFGWSYQSVQKFISRRGLSPQTGSQAWKEAVQRGIQAGGSSLENELSKLLDDYNIHYETQFQLEEFRYDFRIRDTNILIEIQGSYWHTKPQRRQRDLFKQELARKNGFKLLVIWDYQLRDSEVVICKIRNAISPPSFDFREHDVVEVPWSLSSELLEKWHYQGAGRNGLSLGVMVDSRPVAVAVFTNPSRIEISRRQGVEHSEVLELTRFVIHPDYQSKNFASWLIARAIKHIRRSLPNIKLLVSFADKTFGHSGSIYAAGNWQLDGVTSGSYWYYHRRENTIYHKKTIWNSAKALNISESDFARGRSLLKVHGLPKNRYVYWFRS